MIVGCNRQPIISSILIFHGLIFIDVRTKLLVLESQFTKRSQRLPFRFVRTQVKMTLYLLKLNLILFILSSENLTRIKYNRLS